MTSYRNSRLVSDAPPGMFARVLAYDVRNTPVVERYTPPRVVVAGKFGRSDGRPRKYVSEKLVSPW